jgi:hypothetical protein
MILIFMILGIQYRIKNKLFFAGFLNPVPPELGVRGQ